MRNLWKTLGGYDALVEYNECAIRQLLVKWEQNKEIIPDWTEFIKAQSAEVGVRLRNINVEQYRQDIYLWYLVHPYGCMDSFVKEFKEDLKAFGFDISNAINNDDKARDKARDKNAIEKLIVGLKELRITVSVEPYKMDLDSYYRRCRNLFVHKLDNGEKKKIRTLYNNLDKEKIHNFYPNQKLALSAPCEFTFDDYILCTANIKNIADTLTTDIYGSIDWNKYVFEDCKFKAKLKNYDEKPERITGALHSYIRSRYGITLSEEEIDILKKKLTQ